MNLKKLLRPGSIAVIGANDKPGFGLSTCKNLLKSSVADHVYFVNPSRDSLFDKKCYPSIRDLPEQIDMAVIILNKNLITGILEEIAAAGCHAAVVYASGYGETGDKKAEQELKDLCNRHQIALMGVNCAGFINNVDGVSAFGMLLNRKSGKGNIAIISQSGKICLNMMQVDYLDYSYLISGGNNTVITIEDYLEYLINDEDTKVIGVYMEGIKDPEKFKEAIRKAALMRKAIVIMKVGKTAKGSALAASHTGSLSGSDRSFDAVVKKFGIIRVDDIEELVQMCHLFSVLRKLPEKPAISAMCLSGGETGICADMASLLGLEYPDFSPETVEGLKNLLPSYATIANPLDMSATLAHDREKYAAVIRSIMDDPGIGLVICGQTFLPRHETTDVHYAMSEGMVMAANEGKKPLVVVNFLNSDRDPVLRNRLESSGIPMLPAAGSAFKLLRYLMDFINYKPECRTLDLAVSKEKHDIRKKKSLTENESKEELKRFGINIPREVIITDRNELTSINMNYPLVAKIVSPDIQHKSDMGGVALNLQNIKELENGYDNIISNVKKNCPGARVNGVLVCEMLPKGLEMIIGVNNDPQFGPIILCGMGGVFVEVFKDISLYPAPVNRDEALEMIRALKGFKLLDGCRGSDPCDIEALAGLIVRISDYAVEHTDSLAELDINPVFVYPRGRGAAIADMLLVKYE
jgi:acetyltransferase